MSLLRYFLTLLVLNCPASLCLAQQTSEKTPERPAREMIGTSLEPNTCKTGTDDNDESVLICKGVDNFALQVKGDDKKPQITLLAPDGVRHKIQYWDTNDPGLHQLERSVLWLVVHEPRKTIAINLRLKIEPKQDYSQWPFQDIIVRVTPAPVCIVGSEPAGSRSAGESMAIATSPADRPCMGPDELQKRDWFLTARRLAGEGKIDEALSALEQIEGHQRFIIFREISNAQFKAGDVQGARRTLMTAHAEALKKQSDEPLAATLSHVVTGLAEAGFYDEAKSAIKLFKEEEQLRMYLSVASTQGERKDLEAAKITFREAIEQELKRTPLPQRDWNLNRIAESQERLRLYEEAKRTASMIEDPAARKMAEERLQKQPPQPDR